MDANTNTKLKSIVRPLFRIPYLLRLWPHPASLCAVTDVPLLHLQPHPGMSQCTGCALCTPIATGCQPSTFCWCPVMFLGQYHPKAPAAVVLKTCRCRRAKVHHLEAKKVLASAILTCAGNMPYNPFSTFAAVWVSMCFWHYVLYDKPKISPLFWPLKCSCEDNPHSL